jgi:hypothetical protein
MKDRIKKFFQNTWSKIKRWWFALLVALGLASSPLLYAEIVDFTYTAATQRVDGSPLALDDIAFTRLYCDGSLIVQEPGADLDFNPELGIGSHTCYATHVDTDGQESDASNSVIKIVNPARPSAPVLNP